MGMIKKGSERGKENKNKIKKDGGGAWGGVLSGGCGRQRSRASASAPNPGAMSTTTCQRYARLRACDILC